jgi:hypothetical protein
VPLADEVARDPPVGRRRLALLVLGTALDPRQLARRSELAPAEAVVSVEDERGMGRALLHALELPLPVHCCRVLVGAFGMEPDAPAPAEHAVVRLDQRGERVPRTLVERLDREGRRLSH